MSRADKLHAIVERVAPAIAKRAASVGVWGPKGAPYVLDEIDGRKRVVVTDPETGDRVGAIGDTYEAAIDALAAKIGLSFETPAPPAA